MSRCRRARGWSWEPSPGLFLVAQLALALLWAPWTLGRLLRGRP